MLSPQQESGNTHSETAQKVEAVARDSEEKEDIDKFVKEYLERHEVGKYPLSYLIQKARETCMESETVTRRSRSRCSSTSVLPRSSRQQWMNGHGERIKEFLTQNFPLAPHLARAVWEAVNEAWMLITQRKSGRRCAICASLGCSLDPQTRLCSFS